MGPAFANLRVVRRYGIKVATVPGRGAGGGPGRLRAMTRVRAMKDNRIVYRPGQRPGVEVLVDGEWHVGELRMWFQEKDGGPWVGDVLWAPTGSATRLATFPAAAIRPAPL